MKKNITNILGIAVLGLLTACGGDDDRNNLNYYGNLAQACGSQVPSNSSYTQTVRGQDIDGGILDLLIYGDGSGNVGAIGEIQIPDLNAIGIFTNLGGSFGNNFGGFNNNNNFNNNNLNNNFLNSSNSLRSCVSSNGITGFMQTDGIADQISIQLQGSNVSLVPDSNSYATPTINNQYLEGDWILSVSGAGSAVLAF